MPGVQNAEQYGHRAGQEAGDPGPRLGKPGGFRIGRVGFANVGVFVQQLPEDEVSEEGDAVVDDRCSALLVLFTDWAQGSAVLAEDTDCVPGLEDTGHGTKQRVVTSTATAFPQHVGGVRRD